MQYFRCVKCGFKSEKGDHPGTCCSGSIRIVWFHAGETDAFAALESSNKALGEKFSALGEELISHVYGHSAHWDREGNHGRTCPKCIEINTAIATYKERVKELLNIPRPEPDGKE